jgi:hypothetical protein
MTMGDYGKIIDFKNGIEAELFSKLLDSEAIPHTVRSYKDLAFDGIYQTLAGWGHLEAPLEHAGRIRELYEIFSRREFSEPGTGDETESATDPARERASPFRWISILIKIVLVLVGIGIIAWYFSLNRPRFDAHEDKSRQKAPSAIW